MKSIIKSYKKLIFLLATFLVLIVGFFFAIKFSNKPSSASNDNLIVATNFVAYDFARAIVGDTAEIKLLVPAGSDVHSFEPTPDDVLAIKSSSLFIYFGGESEKWVEDLLKNNEFPKEKALALLNFISLREESEVDNPTAKEPEYDEHVWTSPQNAVKLLTAISNSLIEARPENAELYQRNFEIYQSKLVNLDSELKTLSNSDKKHILVFADRFPFSYLAKDYDFEYVSAFPGYAEATEADAKTVASLIEIIKENNLKTVFKIELTSDKLAKSVAKETGAKIVELHSAHNVSKEDFDSGVTYVDLMERNVRALEEYFK